VLSFSRSEDESSVAALCASSSLVYEEKALQGVCRNQYYSSPIRIDPGSALMNNLGMGATTSAASPSMGNCLGHRKEDVGLPCSNTIGSPLPSSRLEFH
jgi:hypothetical protein